VGFDGLFSISMRVFGVMAASSCSGVILNSVSMPASMMTGLPSQSITMSG
jgi:hypothetical protein